MLENLQCLQCIAAVTVGVTLLKLGGEVAKWMKLGILSTAEKNRGKKPLPDPRKSESKK